MASSIRTPKDKSRVEDHQAKLGAGLGLINVTYGQARELLGSIINSIWEHLRSTYFRYGGELTSSMHVTTVAHPKVCHKMT